MPIFQSDRIVSSCFVSANIIFKSVFYVNQDLENLKSFHGVQDREAGRMLKLCYRR